MPEESEYARAASLSDVEEAGCKAVQVMGRTIALFAHDGGIFAVDNRCPHMGFPLERGTVKDGILTCHWHHARFDLASGGTFDLWADDVRSYPVEVRDGEVWVDLAPSRDPLEHQRDRLDVGLERDLPLVIGKAVLVLLEQPSGRGEAFAAGLRFGTRYRRSGWGQGLTMHTCFMNMLPHLDAEDRPRALYQGLSAVAANTAGEAPRFPVRPLPQTAPDVDTLKGWFRQFVEVRDAEGAERCIVSAIRGGAGKAELADMLFAAITDHRYVDVGHPLDFTNKAFGALDAAGWEHAETVLTSLARGYALGERMEESNSWRNPIDLVAILEKAFTQLETMPISRLSSEWDERGPLLDVVLGDDPQAIADALIAALQAEATPAQLAGAVSYAAALRIARFHTSNEFSDWDTALHTFTFANAVEQGLYRAPSRELLRGVFDAAMSVYLDRFLNIPAARLPQPSAGEAEPARDLLERLPPLLDRQQQVGEAGDLVARYLYRGGAPDRLLAKMGHLLLREDRDFHTIQAVEAAFRQFRRLNDEAARVNVLVAAARYLAAHSPTVRAQGQTYEIAVRLHRGDRLYDREGP